MGLTSKQFAIGSTIYYMIKGHEVYGNEWLGAEHLAESGQAFTTEEVPSPGSE
jgi:hypothetical protein